MDGQPPDERLGGPLGLDVVGQLVRPGGEDGVQRGGDVEGEDVAADVPLLGRFFEDLDLVRACWCMRYRIAPLVERKSILVSSMGSGSAFLIADDRADVDSSVSASSEKGMSSAQRDTESFTRASSRVTLFLSSVEKKDKNFIVSIGCFMVFTHHHHLRKQE